MINHKVDSRKKKSVPSWWSFIREELVRDYAPENDEEQYSNSRENLYSLMILPGRFEIFMTYGFMQCCDSFLYLYTFLPLRLILALWALLVTTFTRSFNKNQGMRRKILAPAEINDILKGLILVICTILMMYFDTNRLYHEIKCQCQSGFKLYIIYNVLEICDRFLSAFGQGAMDSLFWTVTETVIRPKQYLDVIIHLIMAIICVIIYSLIILTKAATLNVAINSCETGLLTIMMSNNFIELKGIIFKKFNKNDLFHVSCSDVRERFQLTILLLIVFLQTMKEYSWQWDRFYILVPDCCLVILTEIVVDWTKHAFITHFNKLSIGVYRDFKIILVKDIVKTRNKNASSEFSDFVARKMDFNPLPLGVVMIRELLHTVNNINIASVIIIIIGIIYLFTLYILNILIILYLACDLIQEVEIDEKSTQSPPSKRKI